MPSAIASGRRTVRYADIEKADRHRIGAPESVEEQNQRYARLLRA